MLYRHWLYIILYCIKDANSSEGSRFITGCFLTQPQEISPAKPLHRTIQVHPSKAYLSNKFDAAEGNISQSGKGGCSSLGPKFETTALPVDSEYVSLCPWLPGVVWSPQIIVRHYLKYWNFKIVSTPTLITVCAWDFWLLSENSVYFFGKAPPPPSLIAVCKLIAHLKASNFWAQSLENQVYFIALLDHFQINHGMFTSIVQFIEVLPLLD